MTNEIRAVFDTSVLISAALLHRSIPFQAFQAALAAGRVLTSESTIVELEEVLRRPKFDKYVSTRQRADFLTAFVREAEVVEVSVAVLECRDPKDNKFLELAISGGATHIVSGDDDLLVLHPFYGTRIVTPQVFLTEIRGHQQSATAPSP